MAEPTEGAATEATEDAPAEETEAGGEEATETAEEKPEPKTPPTPAEKRRMKLKVDGDEQERDEEEVIRLAQLRLAEGNRFDAHAKEKKAFEKEKREHAAALEAFKKDPAGFFRKMGMDPREWAEGHVHESMQDDNLTAEQKELRDAKKKLQEIEAEKKSAEEKAQQERIEKLADAEAERLNTELPKLLAAANLPKSPRTLARVAELWLTNEEQGLDLPLESLVDLAREQYLSEVQAIFGSADGEQLLKLLGEQNAKKIRKADLARLRKGPGTTAAPAQTSKPAAKAKGRTKEEFKAYLDRLTASAPREE